MPRSRIHPDTPKPSKPPKPKSVLERTHDLELQTLKLLAAKHNYMPVDFVITSIVSWMSAASQTIRQFVPAEHRAEALAHLSQRVCQDISAHGGAWMLSEIKMFFTEDFRDR